MKKVSGGNGDDTRTAGKKGTAAATFRLWHFVSRQPRRWMPKRNPVPSRDSRSSGSEDGRTELPVMA